MLNPTWRTLSLWILFGSVFFNLTAHADEIEFYQRYSWAGGDTAKGSIGLYVVHQSDDCLAARLFLETPQDERVTLTFSYWLVAGIYSSSLTDEKRGWTLTEQHWTALDLGADGTAPSFEAFFAKAKELEMSGVVPIPHVRLYTSDDHELDVEITNPQIDPAAAVQRAIAEANFWVHMSPADTRDFGKLLATVRLLTCGDREEGEFCTFAGVINTLDSALRGARPPQEFGDEQSRHQNRPRPVLEMSAEGLALSEDAWEFIAIHTRDPLRDPLAGSCKNSEPPRIQTE